MKVCKADLPTAVNAITATTSRPVGTPVKLTRDPCRGKDEKPGRALPRWNSNIRARCGAKRRDPRAPPVHGREVNFTRAARPGQPIDEGPVPAQDTDAMTRRSQKAPPPTGDLHAVVRGRAQVRRRPPQERPRRAPLLVLMPPALTKPGGVRERGRSSSRSDPPPSMSTRHATRRRARGQRATHPQKRRPLLNARADEKNAVDGGAIRPLLRLIPPAPAPQVTRRRPLIAVAATSA